MWLLCMVLLATPGKGALPNVVVLLGDDMGWSNAGWHNKHTQTPFMDQLVAKEGIELDRHYVFFYCSPTRTSLMTGRLPIHVTENNAYACGTDGPAPLNMTFLPAKLKAAGYKTHQIGKWHVGGLASSLATPVSRGFDTSFGYLGGAEDHYKDTNNGCGGCGVHVDLWRNNGPAVGENGTTYSSYRYAAEAEKVLRAHDKDTPLFMYLALQDAHAPNQPDKYGSLYENYTQAFADYNGMLSAADDVARNVTAVLREVGMWNNTLFIFSSDNGGPASKKVSGSAANNYPLRGGKHTAWEGGHRAISFVSGGLVPEAMRGKRLEGYVHIADWYATLCKLAGVDPQDTPAVEAGFPDIDSIDMWPYLSGTALASPRTEVPLSSRYADHPRDVSPLANGSAALIVGEYKLVRFAQPYCFWMGPVYPNASTTHKDEPDCTCGEEGCLFNIITDPGEHIDLKADMPEKHRELLNRAQELDLTSIEHGRPVGWRGRVDSKRSCEQVEQNGGFWGPYQ